VEAAVPATEPLQSTQLKTESAEAMLLFLGQPSSSNYPALLACCRAGPLEQLCTSDGHAGHADQPGDPHVQLQVRWLGTTQCLSAPPMAAHPSMWPGQRFKLRKQAIHVQSTAQGSPPAPSPPQLLQPHRDGGCT